MVNMAVTNIDNGSLVIERGEYEWDTLSFGAAGTVKEGTLLARDTTTKKLIPYVKGGSSAGNGVPVYVCTTEVVATGSGDIPVRVPSGGIYRRDKLVIHADGDASNIDGVVITELLDYGVIVRTVTEQNIQDNQ